MNKKILLAVLFVGFLTVIGYAAGQAFVKYPMPDKVHQALMSNNKMQGKMIIQFGADWCGYCHALTDTLEKEKMIPYFKSHRVEFYQWDFGGDVIDSKNKTITGLSQKMGITQVPVLLFLENGRVVNRKNGFNQNRAALTMQQIKDFVEK